MTNKHQLVHHFLEHAAAAQPDKTAVIHDGARYTYADIDRWAGQFASWLIGQGVKKGDRVLVLLFNGVEYVVSYYGAMKAGAIPVSLSTGITAEGLRPIIDELEPAACVTSKRFEDVFIQCGPACAGIKNILVKSPEKSWPGGFRPFHGTMSWAGAKSAPCVWMLRPLTLRASSTLPVRPERPKA